MLSRKSASLSVLLALAGVGLAQAQQNAARVILVSSSVNPPSVSNVYYLGAMEGAFAKHNIEVQLQQSSGSPSSVAAIISGKAQFASINLNTLANAAAEGVKGKIVVAGNFDFPGLILSRPEITTAKMLEGKTMASSALGSIEYTVARAWLVNQGVDFGKINWVSTRQSTVTVQVLMSGQAAAAWFNMASAVTALAKAPSLHILANAESLAKTAPSTGGIIVVTDRFAQQNPELIQHFVEAIIEGNRLLYKDQAVFDETVEKWIPGVYNAEQKQLLYDAYRPSWGVNGGLNLKVMGEVLAGWKSDVNPDRARNPNFSKIEDLVDTRFVRAALAKLGVQQGALDDAAWLR
jgi:ABC-type nitrate/sulfonate/bicarbonate transport system substrate-binding protein